MVRNPGLYLIVILSLFLGWGDTGLETATDILQETEVPIVDNSACLEKMDQSDFVNGSTIVCAGSQNTGPCKVPPTFHFVSIEYLLPRVTVVDHLL